MATAARPYQTYEEFEEALQVAPGVFVPAENADEFLDQLDNDPDTLHALIQMLEAIPGEFTHDNIDPAIWETYGPIFQHINAQRRVAAGDPQAVALARACAAWRRQEAAYKNRVRSIRLTPFSEAKS